jgi:hypothetical protein
LPVTSQTRAIWIFLLSARHSLERRRSSGTEGLTSP